MNKRILVLAIFLIIFGCIATAHLGKAQQGVVYVIEVDGTIDAGISNFIRKSIDRAERDNVALIIKMNTPGGLLSATKEIVDRMLNAKVKLVVWVTPRGAWAYSAGTFILLASNTAAMDNGTTIGAAQPRPEDPKITAAMAEWIGEVADQRGRPKNVAELFVAQNLTMGPQEALDNGIIELRASSVDEILDNIGLSGARVETLEMGIFEKVLRVLSDPNIVSILFIAGLLGILAEITTPGIGVPGIAGVICLLLAFWGLGVLEINYVGVALILLGVVLIAAELFTPGFGVFGIGGGVALFLGLLMIDKEPWIEVAGNVAKGMAIVLLAVFAIFIVLARRAMKKPVAVGKEELIGKIGVAATNIAPEGLVRLKGELWTAVSKVSIKTGEKVVVKDIRGIKLIVVKHRKRWKT
ncbi:MAG: nodulation protein NfeD [Hadesarchaea archaeon]|nr:MAG: nodulation protein NfeD [Hadesarchaea archaeon]